VLTHSRRGENRPTAGCTAPEQAACRAAEKRDEFAPPDPSCHLIPLAEEVMRPNDSTVVAAFPQAVAERSLPFRQVSN
jgi:hypothetical protein